jgi:hypothetical protein
MELLVLLIIAGVAGYFIGNWRRKKKASPPASQDVVEATAKDVVAAEKEIS